MFVFFENDGNVPIWWFRWKNDFIGIKVTKTAEYDDIQVNGYKVCIQHRQKSIRRSRDIGLASKDSISSYVIPLEYVN